MKLCTFRKNGKYALGVKTARGIIDVEAASSGQPHVPQTVMEVIAGGQAALQALEELIATQDSGAQAVLNEEDLEWGPCVTDPGKIICVGLNYRKHADETNSPYPEVPILFNKYNNALTGHNCDIAVPKMSAKVDYEVELGLVIGRTAKHVSRENALDYIFGYCAANDVSARDLQLRTRQWMLGKTCDGFCPLGPYLVTADEVGNPNNLQLKTVVNGELRQNSNTADMIFDCAEIVSYISRHMTLYPGDVILTGTPEGVILGLPPEQQRYLQPGDVVTVEVEKLGALTNRFVAE
jgi:2-keto-4-pentenoate hydratase/2-oxohepta-3-ene-1,7-dioic acid hydratase in catechol pathway